MACEGRGEIPTVLRSAAVLKESDKGAPINPVSIVAQFPEGGSTVSFNRDALAADALRSKG